MSEKKDDVMEFEGVVENVIKDKVFVKTDSGQDIICTIAGKIRQSGIRILPGDRVLCHTSIYSPLLGRVVYRLKA